VKFGIPFNRIWGLSIH
jgi:hypothetical protein